MAPPLNPFPTVAADDENRNVDGMAHRRNGLPEYQIAQSAVAVGAHEQHVDADCSPCPARTDDHYLFTRGSHLQSETPTHQTDCHRPEGVAGIPVILAWHRCQHATPSDAYMLP